MSFFQHQLLQPNVRGEGGGGSAGGEGGGGEGGVWVM